MKTVTMTVILAKTAMAMTGKKLVEGLISSKAVLVISKSYCPFCKKAKSALQEYKLNPEVYEWMDIENRDDCNEIQGYMKQLTGASSVPRVFIGGKCIGGGDETVAAHRSGKLEGMLREAGALL